MEKLNDVYGIGNPRKFRDSCVFMLCQLYLGLGGPILVSLILTMEERGDRDSLIYTALLCEYIGTLLPAIVAPFIDNTRTHRLIIVIGFVITSALLSTSFMVVMTFNLDILVSFAVLASTVVLTNTIFVSYETMQIDDTIGTRSRKIVMIHYIGHYFVRAVAQLALFWNPTAINFLSVGLIACSPLPMLGIAIYLYVTRHRAIEPRCNRGDTFLVLNCVLRGLQLSKDGIFFDRMLQHYSYAIVANAKKTCKLLLLSLSFSMIETIMRLQPLQGIRQYQLTQRTGLFQYTEFNTLTSLLIAFFIAVVELGLVPILRKLKQPFPIFTILMISGYVVCVVGHGYSIWTEYKTETICQVRLEGKRARVFLYNALDTYSHVWLSHDPNFRATVPSGSMISLVVSVPEDELPFGIDVLNPWYVASYSVSLRSLQPLKTTAYVLTREGAYEITAKGFIRSLALSPITPPETTLTFICAKKRVGETYIFNTWCSANVSVHSDNSYQEPAYNMLQYGDASVITVTPDQTFKVLVDYPVDYNHNPLPITFQPLQGGKYVFVMWPGDTQIVVKHRIIQLLDPFPINAYAALPHIIIWSFGQALYRTSLIVVFIINTPHAVQATSWAWRVASMRLFDPLLFLLKKFEYTDAKHELIVLAIEVLLFIVLLVALRAARYHR